MYKRVMCAGGVACMLVASFAGGWQVSKSKYQPFNSVVDEVIDLKELNDRVRIYASVKKSDNRNFNGKQQRTIGIAVLEPNGMIQFVHVGLYLESSGNIGISVEDCGVEDQYNYNR